MWQDAPSACFGWLFLYYLSSKLMKLQIDTDLFILLQTHNESTTDAKFTRQWKLCRIATLIHCILHMGIDVSLLSICIQAYINQPSGLDTHWWLFKWRYHQREADEWPSNNEKLTRNKTQSNQPWSILRNISNPCHVCILSWYPPSIQFTICIQSR